MRPLLLDLFCGAGGCSVGYNRAGFDCVGVDNRPMPRYPFPFILRDAIDVLTRIIAGEKFLANDGQWYGLEDFSAIHASPPCQEYSTLAVTNRALGQHKTAPDLIVPIREALRASGKPYMIENVQGAPLHTQFILCGHSLGLVRLARHRHFESNVFVPRIACTHRRVDGLVGVYGDLNGRRVSPKKHKWTRAAKGLADASDAMGIDWMTEDEITQAIPPAYTEFIGGHLLNHILSERSQTADSLSRLPLFATAPPAEGD